MLTSGSFLSNSALLIFFIFYFLFCFTTALTSNNNNNFFNEEIDHIFRNWNSPRSPGVFVGIIRNQEFIFKKGYGMADLSFSVPISENMNFDMASISKQFTALAIAILEQDGFLRFSDPVKKFIPEFPSNFQSITISHLIYHTSGLRDYIDLHILAGDGYQYSPKDTVELICRQKNLAFPPGDRHSYSNTGYFLLSVIVERITKTTLKDFVKQKILNPLRMNGSFYNDDQKQVIINKAMAYSEVSASTSRTSQNPPLFKIDMFHLNHVGDGGLISNINDLALFDRNLYHNILGSNPIKLMETFLTLGKLNNGTEFMYAFGLMKTLHRGSKLAWWHSGRWGGYCHIFLRFPNEKLTIIILGNRGVSVTQEGFQIADLYLFPNSSIRNSHSFIQNGQEVVDYPSSVSLELSEMDVRLNDNIINANNDKDISTKKNINELSRLIELTGVFCSKVLMNTLKVTLTTSKKRRHINKLQLHVKNMEPHEIDLLPNDQFRWLSFLFKYHRRRQNNDNNWVVDGLDVFFDENTDIVPLSFFKLQQNETICCCCCCC